MTIALLFAIFDYRKGLRGSVPFLYRVGVCLVCTSIFFLVPYVKFFTIIQGSNISLSLLLWALIHDKRGRYIMNTFFGCIVAVGLFIIIGAAGSTDINSISLSQALIYALIGIIVVFVGVMGCKITKNRG